MKKITALVTITVASATQAATGFKSTQDAMNAIANTYNTLLQAPNIFDKSISFKELVALGDKLSEHIMKKQGPLNGKKSARKGNYQGTCALNGTGIDHCDNIFDLWDVYVFDQFTRLINDLKEERLTRNKHGKAFQGLGWHLMAFENIIKQAKKIEQNSILSDKKKLADIIIFFAEHAIELVRKAKPEVG